MCDYNHIVDAYGSCVLDTSEADADTDADSDADTDADSDTDTDADTDADPTKDTDGDGFYDVEEDAWGTGIKDPYSWPYTSSSWPDFTDEAAADGVVGTGMGIGDEMPDHTLTDQYGRPVRLYDFYGHVVLLVMSAAWSGPDGQMTQALDELWEANRESGFVVVQVLVENGAGATTSVADLDNWSDKYNLYFPVALDPEETLFDGLIDASTFDAVSPSYLLLDRTMTIDSAYAGTGTEHHARIDALLTK